MKYFRLYKGLFALSVLTVVVMAAVPFFDEQVTYNLHAHRWPLLERWMNRSVFEAEVPGLNDPVVFYLLAVVWIYYLGWRGNTSRRISALRPLSGFVLTSALTGSIYMVHSLKWIVGRARPNEVLHEGLPFSHWFTFGPHFVTEGIYHGAFPGGHAAQIFILMSLAYLLAADPLSSGRVRVVGWAMGVLCMVLSSAMAVARCMSLSHWLSDSLFSILVGWLVMHLLYFHILRVPDQRRYHHDTGYLPAVPPVWEIVLCIYLLMGVIGVMAVLIGARSLIIDKAPWLVLVVPLGAGAVWLARQRTVALLAEVHNALESETP